MSDMVLDADPRRRAILEAANVQFGRYGFRRTSMEDIAKQTGVSRASLYSHFENKEEIFRELSIALHEEALENAARELEAKPDDALLEKRIQKALEAKLGGLHDLVSASPHGSEIMDENSRLCGDVVSASAQRFNEMLTLAFQAGAKSGEINLKGAGLTPDAAAELVRLAASGLKHGATDATIFRTRLRKLVRVLFAGLK